MKTYGWTQDYVRKGLTGAQGWAFYNWALESESRNAGVWGAVLDRKSPGYVKQEMQRMLNGC